MTRAETYRIVAAADGCPSFAPIDVAALRSANWEEPEPAIAFHRQLRAEHGGTLPEQGVRVLVSWRGAHHSSVSGSLVAVRGVDGRWSADSLIASRSMMPPPPGRPAGNPVDVSRQSWRLSESNGSALDRLLAGRCLPAEPRSIILYGGVPTTSGGPIGCTGGAVSIIEAFVGGARMAAAQHCGRWGAWGEVDRLLTADAPA